MPTLTDEPTLTLLQRLRAGDAAARERLVARYLPRLTRWAHGRLPTGARDLSDTHGPRCRIAAAISSMPAGRFTA